MQLYGNKAPATAQKLVIIAIELALIVLSFWIMFGKGEALFSNLFGWPIALETPRRRTLVLLFSFIVFIRMTFAMFQLMKRDIPWSETLSVPFAFALYYVGFAILVLPSHQPLDWIDFGAIILFALGCYFNTASEMQRSAFKKKSENKGKLYTSGLFSLSMHINFFGDILWVIAYALVARNPWGTFIPVILVSFFAFYNVPMLDRYLANRYGAQFDAYARRTKKLIPFIW